jgi:alpha-L-fucosidase
VDPDEPVDFESSQTVEFAGESKVLGDFGTPEHHITAESNRLWESCQVSTWRLWGYTRGERWRPAEVMLDMLCEAAGKGGNLLMNVGPQPDGQLPAEFVQRARHIGDWLRVHGEAIYDCERGDVVEFVTRGWQTRKGNNLYLILRFWDGRSSLRIAGLATKVLHARLLTTGQELRVEQNETELTLHGLPSLPPTDLFPVIKLEGEAPFEAQPWARERLWCGNPRRMTQWARSRGTSVWADGKPRE